MCGSTKESRTWLFRKERLLKYPMGSILFVCISVNKTFLETVADVLVKICMREVQYIETLTTICFQVNI